MDDITDEELQALILSGGGIAEQDAEIKKAAAMAELIRNMTPNATMRGNTRVQTAANPLEHIATLGSAYLQKKQLDKGSAAEVGKAKAMTGQNQAILAALLRKKKLMATGGAAFSARPMPGEDEEDPLAFLSGGNAGY